MNPFKSIRGLMLGILLLGVNWPIWAGLTPGDSQDKAQEGPKMAVHEDDL